MWTFGISLIEEKREILNVEEPFEDSKKMEIITTLLKQMNTTINNISSIRIDSSTIKDTVHNKSATQNDTIYVIKRPERDGWDKAQLWVMIITPLLVIPLFFIKR